MTDLDRETRDAIDALAHRLRTREPGTDDEVFAAEFITALRGRGWRPTEAKPPPHWKHLQQRPGPAEGTYSRGAAAARESLGGAA